jgi:hypothetical protein
LDTTRLEIIALQTIELDTTTLDSREFDIHNLADKMNAPHHYRPLAVTSQSTFLKRLPQGWARAPGKLLPPNVRGFGGE